MEPTGGHLLPEMDVHLERQMRSQERQLAVVRATIAGAALVAIVLFRDQLSSFEGLAGLAIFVLLYTGGILVLVGRFPAREVGIVATALDMVVVTVAIYIEPQALDAVPVLRAGHAGRRPALRPRLRRSGHRWSWPSCMPRSSSWRPPPATRRASAADPYRLPDRPGAAAGLFARVAIDRATENAQLQQRLGGGGARSRSEVARPSC